MEKNWRKKEGDRLYFLDEHAQIRFSHENPDVQKLYEDFLERPLSHKAHMLLHTLKNYKSGRYFYPVGFLWKKGDVF